MDTLVLADGQLEETSICLVQYTFKSSWSSTAIDLQNQKKTQTVQDVHPEPLEERRQAFKDRSGKVKPECVHAFRSLDLSHQYSL